LTENVHIRRKGCALRLFNIYRRDKDYKFDGKCCFWATDGGKSQCYFLKLCV